MEDDKKPASPRKRATTAKPTDTSSPSAAADSTADGADRTPLPRKIPPATFVPPVAPSEPVTPGAAAPSAAPPATGTSPARKSPAKIAKRAPKKAAPAAESAAPAAPPEQATPAPAKKTPKKAAPKAAAAKKAAPPAVATPGVPPHKALPPATIAEPAAATSPLWSTIKVNPGYATELLALAAVEHLGPAARADLAWLRDTYPTATIPGLVRIATSRSVGQARVQGAVAGLLGPLAVLAETGALLWTQARLVLDVAAAYGRDPADPERAAELLVLQRVHPDLTAARAAVTAARAAAVTAGAGASDRQVTLALVRLAGRALGRATVARRAARLVPGAGAALTAILDGRATEQLAVRATRFYRA